MKRFLVAAVILLALAGSVLMGDDYRRTGFGVVLPSGVAASPAMEMEGALYLDTDHSANGTIRCYIGGAWRTVVELP